MSDILISIENYNGPLDLLLDLIKKNEINIYDIPINFITEEYLTAIRQNIDLGIEVQVEFLYLAASLINIKTKMLLPRSIDEDDDPRMDLVEQLIVYSRFKIVQDDMWNLFNLNQCSYDNILNPEYFNTNTNYTIQYNINKLYESFTNIISSYEQELNDEVLIVRERYRTEDLINNIKEILFDFNKISLKEISKNKGREYLITSFLAILELMNSGLIICNQENLFSDIIIEKK